VNEITAHGKGTADPTLSFGRNGATADASLLTHRRVVRCSYW
jgi:hypothetical protein